MIAKKLAQPFSTVFHLLFRNIRSFFFVMDKASGINKIDLQVGLMSDYLLMVFLSLLRNSISHQSGKGFASK